MNLLTHSQPAKCPLCMGAVPLEIVRLRSSFPCPSCGNALKVNRVHALAVKFSALVAGCLIARGLGFDSVMLFWFGVMIWPFLIVALWRVSASIRVTLVPAYSDVITLSLHGD